MNLPQYDEVHVVSDLHLGGRPGFQVFREGKRLAGFIGWVASQRPEGRVALVLNGDVIDSLAESIDGYVAIDDALPMIQRIFQDAAFAPVWEALGRFVATPKRTLVMVIGNHDIELAFPAVQRAIVERLAREDLAARARIEFSTMGAGYPCLVGNARVFCTHGNEVDAWNYVRYEDLAKAARRMSAGRALAPSEWEPNAGTKMVKDVMNAVKQRYAWIDLLKPEAQATVGVLLVLDPSQLAKINRLIPVIGERARGGGEVDQRLSADGYAAAPPAVARAPRADHLLGPNLSPAVKGANQMLLQAELTYADRAAAAPGPGELLGTPQFIWDRLTGWISGVGKDEALRRALKDWLADDRTFAVDARDETFKAVTGTVGANVDFIVTGHTHLERAIDMGSGRYYFNTGTWIRLLALSGKLLDDTGTFKEVYKVLVDGSMRAIDGASFYGEPFVLERSSAVCIRAEGGGTVGELVHVKSDGAARAPVGAPFRRP